MIPYEFRNLTIKFTKGLEQINETDFYSAIHDIFELKMNDDVSSNYNEFLSILSSASHYVSNAKDDDFNIKFINRSAVNILELDPLLKNGNKGHLCVSYYIPTHTWSMTIKIYNATYKLEISGFSKKCTPIQNIYTAHRFLQSFYDDTEFDKTLLDFKINAYKRKIEA